MTGGITMRVVAGLLVFIMLVLSTGYQREILPSSPNIQEVSVSQGEGESDNDVAIPQHILNLYTELDACSKENDSDFFLTDLSPTRDGSSYKISFSNTENTGLPLSAYFDAEDDEKSFNVFFDSGKDGRLIKDFIVAVIQITNSSKDSHVAKKRNASTCRFV
jgi:hypothetical protein